MNTNYRISASTGRICVLTGFILASSVFTLSVRVVVCIYGEVVLAFERGNEVRGLALMEIAVREGDQRAVHFLTLKYGKEDQGGQTPLYLKRDNGKYLVMDTSTSTQDFK